MTTLKISNYPDLTLAEILGELIAKMGWRTSAQKTMLTNQVMESLESKMAIDKCTTRIKFPELEEQGLFLAQVLFDNNLYNNKPTDYTLDIKIDTSVYNKKALAYSSNKNMAKSVIEDLVVSKKTITALKDHQATLTPTAATPFFMAIVTAAEKYKSHQDNKRLGASTDDLKNVDAVNHLLSDCYEQDIAGIKIALGQFFNSKKSDGSCPHLKPNAFLNFLLDELNKLPAPNALLDGFTLAPATQGSYRHDNVNNFLVREAFIAALQVPLVRHDKVAVVERNTSSLGALGLATGSIESRMDNSALYAKLFLSEHRFQSVN